MRDGYYTYCVCVFVCVLLIVRRTYTNCRNTRKTYFGERLRRRGRRRRSCVYAIALNWQKYIKMCWSLVGSTHARTRRRRDSRNIMFIA